MRLRVGACTDRGQKRPINEDAYACHPDIGVFVVCDGMGGEAAGEVASQLATKTISSQLNGADRWARGKAAGPSAGFQPQTRRLEAALQLSNRAILEESRRNKAQTGMGTTAVSAWIQNNLASLAHVGDSRAYLWRYGNLERLTRDHSLVEEQMAAGLLTAEQAQQSEQQNILLRVLGREPSIEVELAEIPLIAGDYLLLCTDGLTRMVSESALAEAIAILRDPKKICSSLVEQANQNGGVDNITVVVAKIEEDSLWRRLWSRLRK